MSRHLSSSYGARSFFEFFIDLAEIPDVVEAAMEAIVPHLTARTVRAAEQRGSPAVWVGGWSGAPCLLFPEMWRRFVWRYFSRVVHEVVDSGLIAVLHLDSDWTRELSHFRELPRGRCILALDGYHRHFRSQERLGRSLMRDGRRSRHDDISYRFSSRANLDR